MTNRIACAVSRLCSENSDPPVMDSIKTTQHSLLVVTEFLQLTALATVMSSIHRESVN